MTDQKICIAGIWHLGSVVSACLADLGYTVVGVDADRKKVDDLNKGTPPLFEPGLPELISANIEQGRLSYTTDLNKAVEGAGYVLITFDTPVNDRDEVDLSEIFDIAQKLSPVLENGSVIMVSSQVPVGTCEEIRKLIRKNNPSLDFDIAYSPENLRLGQAIRCFMEPERIVIGADSETTLDSIDELFSVIDAPKVRMNLKSAEMTKHALNAFLGMSISFINEIANLCDETGADSLKVAEALLSDERVSPKAPMKPGLGFSGGTIARDLNVLRKLGEAAGYMPNLINGVLEVNKQQNRLVSRKLEKIYGTVAGLSIGVLGLTYKPGTSTLRRSSSLEIIDDLAARGARIKAHDPKADRDELKQHTEFIFCPDPYEAAKETDVLVLITPWPEFTSLDYGRILSLMKKPVLIDTQNMLDDVAMKEIGFQYYGVGRGNEYK